MKRIVILIITAVALFSTANAQIVSSHYNDSYGSPYFRLDGMMSSYSSSEESSFIPSSDGFHGTGFNASIGYYVPISRSLFFYAPEVGITGRIGNDKADADDTNFDSYTGFGLKLVPLQFGYQFEISPSVAVCPRIGVGVSFFPTGKISYKSGDQTNKRDWDWDQSFDTLDLQKVIGCDFVFRNSNFLLSLVLESGGFTQAGIGIGFLF